MVHNKPQSKELFDSARGKGAIRADYMLLDGGFWESKPPLPFWKRFTEGVITARFFRPQQRQKEANLFLLSVYFGGQRLVTSIFRIITYYIYAKTEIKSYSVTLFSKNIIFLCSFSLSLTIQSLRGHLAHFEGMHPTIRSGLRWARLAPSWPSCPPWEWQKMSIG